jgi:hypothetical protein
MREGGSRHVKWLVEYPGRPSHCLGREGEAFIVLGSNTSAMVHSGEKPCENGVSMQHVKADTVHIVILHYENIIFYNKL